MLVQSCFPATLPVNQPRDVLRGVRLHGRKDVSVQIQRYLDVLVAQSALDDVRRNPRRQEQRRARVAQPVNVDVIRRFLEKSSTNGDSPRKMHGVSLSGFNPKL